VHSCPFGECFKNASAAFTAKIDLLGSIVNAPQRAGRGDPTLRWVAIAADVTCC
jgi:hypothetical protein